MRRILVTAGLLALFVLVAPVMAQVNEGDVSPDALDPLKMERPIWEWVCAFGFGAAALAIGFMPSKRSHDE